MVVQILSDSDWEAKVDHATRGLSLRRHFECLDFGGGVLKLCIILNARNRELEHRRRERFTKADKCLSFDVMLDRDLLIHSTHQRRRDIICESVCSDLSQTLDRRRIPDFDSATFLAEFARVIRNDLQGPKAGEFDHLCLEQATGT